MALLCKWKACEVYSCMNLRLPYLSLFVLVRLSLHITQSLEHGLSFCLFHFPFEQKKGITYNEENLPRYSALIIQAKWIIIEQIFFFLVVGAIFKWKSRVILDCIGFPLLCFAVGPENFYQPLNQSGMKFKKLGNPELMVSLVLCFQEGCLFLFKVLLALWHFHLFSLVVVITLVFIFWLNPNVLHSPEKCIVARREFFLTDWKRLYCTLCMITHITTFLLKL